MTDREQFENLLVQYLDSFEDLIDFLEDKRVKEDGLTQISHLCDLLTVIFGNFATRAAEITIEDFREALDQAEQGEVE